MSVNICIPKVNNESLNKSLIINVFEKINIGHIGNIIIKKSGCVYVYINKWFDNDIANNYKNKLVNGESIYITYDNKYGWFWKCVMIRQ